jgi:hypothetical protein
LRFILRGKKMNHTTKIVIAIVLICSAVSFAGTYSGGTGEPNSPYQIASKVDLLTLAATPTDYGKCFILTADVNMQGQVFTMAIIAPDTNSIISGFQGTAFTGTFDGSGHKVTHFTIVKSGSNWYFGLFGKINTGGLVKNLGLENFSVSGSSYSSWYVGGLVGNNNGSISNCYSTGSVSGCSSVGGLVGVNNYGSISNCYSTGAVSSGDDYCVGGLVGDNYSGNISNCYSTGTVSGPWYVGGLVGGNNYSGNISNCYSTSAVSSSAGSSNIGGLVGGNVGSISNCYSRGAVSGSSYVGGLVGGNDYSGNISNCYSSGSVSGSSIYYIGGLVGLNHGNISNCYSRGAVSGSSIYIGGLVGTNYSGSINSSFWDVNTSGQATSAGGTGKTTTEMKMLSTFTSAGWDFTNETVNGTNDYWRMWADGIDYPHLTWELYLLPPPDPPAPNILSMGCDGYITAPPPGKDKLVVITHGWSPPWDLLPNADWVTDMVNALSGVVDNSVWVQPYYWLDACHTYYAPDALANGMERGSLLGWCIANDNQWQHVHLIGHSAGAGVIFAAANELVRQRAMGNFSGTIHLTFLDPFSPSTIANAYASVLGPNDWADNYYIYDISDSLTNGDTSKNFNCAHNVDITNVGASHGFPIDWYHATITGKYPNDANLGNDNLYNGLRYGFPRGLEAGEPNWQESLGLPVGNSPIFIGESLKQRVLKKIKAISKKIQAFTNSYIISSVTGLNNILADGISLFTQSPVWVHTLIDMPESTNYVRFTYQFNGTGDGYLTAYFNENLILIGDQRFDSNQPHDSGKIMVGNLMQEDNWLTFRLDPIEQGQANIFISNIEIGTITNQADLNDDLTVNVADFAMFVNEWLAQDCNENNNWCQGCDFDQSGNVDNNDMAIFACNWQWRLPKPIKADLNFSGAVDFVDFSIFANQWLNNCNSPDWCYGCDFDKSGKVDMFDLKIFAENWLKGTVP